MHLRVHSVAGWGRIMVAAGLLAVVVAACNQNPGNVKSLAGESADAQPADRRGRDGARDSRSSGMQIRATAAELVAKGEIRQREDAGNPYGGYQAIDQWLWDNCKALSEKPNTLNNEIRGGGALSITLVDSKGWVLSFSEAALLREGARHSRRPLAGYRYLIALGPMDAETRLAFERADMAARASFYPPVPGWLAATPPENGAILLPNGDILAHGALRKQPWEQDSTRPEWSSTSYRKYLYTREGELRGEITDGLAAFYNPAIEAELQVYKRQLRTDGKCVLVDRGTGEFVKAYDYEGKPLPGDPGNDDIDAAFNLHSPEDLAKLALAR